MKLLLLVDLVVVCIAIAIWFAHDRDDQRSNAANPGLRGSRPPAGQSALDFSDIGGVEPRVPAPARWLGAPLLLVSTCLDCQSGELIGGFLRLLATRDLPEGTHVVVVGWDGDGPGWRARWQVGAGVDVHVATTQAGAALVRGLARIDDTGFAYLYDPQGVWRSSFTASTLQVDDVVHDLDAVAG